LPTVPRNGAVLPALICSSLIAASGLVAFGLLP